MSFISSNKAPAIITAESAFKLPDPIFKKKFVNTSTPTNARSCFPPEQVEILPRFWLMPVSLHQAPPEFYPNLAAPSSNFLERLPGISNRCFPLLFYKHHRISSGALISDRHNRRWPFEPSEFQ